MKLHLIVKKTEDETNDSRIYCVYLLVLNNPFWVNHCRGYCFLNCKQTPNPVVSPANLGTQNNSNMTGQKMEPDGASISNGALTHRTGPHTQNAVFAADILRGCGVSPTRDKYQVSIPFMQNEVTASINGPMSMTRITGNGIRMTKNSVLYFDYMKRQEDQEIQ